MKQALIVDRRGTVAEFASSVLARFELTTVETLQEAVILASIAPYQLIVIARPDLRCPSMIWSVVEKLKRVSEEPAIVIVQAPEAGQNDFQARARSLGVIVLGTPLDVGIGEAIQEAILP